MSVAAVCVQLFDPGAGLAQFCFARRTQVLAERLGRGRERDQGKAIVGPERVERRVKADLACRSFSSSMLEDVSITSTRSRGIGRTLAISLGHKSSRKKPRWPGDSRSVKSEKPRRADLGAK